METPVILVGNKKDQINERVVRLSDGQERYQKISCAGFYEISVRESAEEVLASYVYVFIVLFLPYFIHRI